MKNNESWRPDNWDEINPKPIGKSMACAFNREDMYKHGKACADAMLEALKSKDDTVRLKFDGTSKIPAHGDYPEIIIEGKPYDKGWLVFIPEEAKE